MLLSPLDLISCSSDYQKAVHIFLTNFDLTNLADGKILMVTLTLCLHSLGTGHSAYNCIFTNVPSTYCHKFIFRSVLFKSIFVKIKCVLFICDLRMKIVQLLEKSRIFPRYTFKYTKTFLIKIKKVFVERGCICVRDHSKVLLKGEIALSHLSASLLLAPLCFWWRSNWRRKVTIDYQSVIFGARF